MRTLVASDEPERPGEPAFTVTSGTNTSSGNSSASWFGIVRIEDVPEGPTREPFRTQAYVEKPREIEP